MRQPRLAEMVAADLRERIVDGTLPDGGDLPTLDRLVQEFSVSPPSIREALRILENERLITVRRGSVGGAIVHRPKPEAAAYMMGLVLQASQTRTVDLAGALTELGTVCAGLCARRTDRRKKVVPALRQATIEIARKHRRHRGDGEVGPPVPQRDHPRLRQRDTHPRRRHVGTALGPAKRGLDLSRARMPRRRRAVDLRQRGFEEHRAIADAIEAGEAELAEKLYREHVRSPEIYSVRKRDARVRATDIAWSDPIG